MKITFTLFECQTNNTRNLRPATFVTSNLKCVQVHKPLAQVKNLSNVFQGGGKKKQKNIGGALNPTEDYYVQRGCLSVFLHHTFPGGGYCLLRNSCTHTIHYSHQTLHDTPVLKISVLGQEFPRPYYRARHYS